MNDLISLSNLTHNAINFSAIKNDDYLPSLTQALHSARTKLATFKQGLGSSFQDVIIPLEALNEELEIFSNIFFNLHSANTSEKLEELAPEVSKQLTIFGSDISLDPIVFAKVKECYDSRSTQKLNQEQLRVLETYYVEFARNGALLDDAQKTKLRAIDEELSQVGVQFSQNVLKAQNSYELLLTDKSDLDGLPKNVIEQLADAAQKKNKTGWLVTLDASIVVPFLTYAKKRELRKTVFVAFSSKAFGGEFDNQENIKKLVSLRHDRAVLLGFKSHADYILKERMAESPEKVQAFLDELYKKALPAAKKEFAKLENLQLELEGKKDLQRYDSSFYSEILKQRELKFDDEMLRPFFKLENVINGIFKVAERLYGLHFVEKADIPVYHPDVKVYEVRDNKKEYVGMFYADFFPRESKRGGAWMTNFMSQGHFFGEVRRPHVGIVCNFTKSTQTTPSLLSLDEVQTFFHEFGHALHGLLSKCYYRKLSGTNVYWDFVELPSQVMENWVLEKECLDLFAVHYETGAKITEDLIEKIKLSGKFLEGLGTMRQLSFATLDMSYHNGKLPSNLDVPAHEAQVTKHLSLFPQIPETNGSCAFSHIFAGGYSAGYYSYKWAEVLDADAFAYFQEEGIFNNTVAQKFREHILERGGTEHPMELYKKFRGKEPQVDSLLKRAGLLE